MTPGHLVVRVAGITAALPVAAVRRVARALPLVPLPGAGPGLLGLVEFAGEPLAVLDLAFLLGVGREPERAPAVTVVAWIGGASERELVGLAVDEALDVILLQESAADGEALFAGAPVRRVDLERLGETA